MSYWLKIFFDTNRVK